MFAFCQEWIPLWNPMNVCSYHLQEAGATPVQEIAYSLATAIDVLDAVQDSGQVPEDRMVNVVASISFFVNAGIRFVEETCKMRAFTQMWDRICLERYGITDPKARRFRYGVQVNSLGLTEAQPENNVQRIVLEALGVTLSKDARARSLQLPAWNEALGLPRPWDQQWALRIQQVLAFETDLLEYDDIFDGSHVIEAKTAELIDGAQAELDDVLALGGAFEAIDELKGRLVRSHAERMRRIESGDLKVVGVNTFTETAPSPLDGDDNILKVDPGVPGGGHRRPGRVARQPRQRRREAQPRRAAPGGPLRRERHAAPPSTWPTPAAPPASGPAVLREEFGEYRAPTGVAAAAGAGGGSDGLRAVAERVQAHGRRPAPVPGGQARPRRPLQRRRADRRGRPRRRLRGHLPGHPPHPRADRRRGPRRGRRRGRPVDPVGQPPRAGARGRPPARAEGRRPPRSSPAASSPRTTGPACSPPAWPPSTPPRTSRSPRSWARSPTWSAQHRDRLRPLAGRRRADGGDPGRETCEATDLPMERPCSIDARCPEPSPGSWVWLFAMPPSSPRSPGGGGAASCPGVAGPRPDLPPGPPRPVQGALDLQEEADKLARENDQMAARAAKFEAEAIAAREKLATRHAGRALRRRSAPDPRPPTGGPARGPRAAAATTSPTPTPACSPRSSSTPRSASASRRPAAACGR